VKGTPDCHDLEHPEMGAKIVRAAFDQLHSHIGFCGNIVSGRKHGRFRIHRNDRSDKRRKRNGKPTGSAAEIEQAMPA
jgi:hypothetical protein